MTRIQSTLTWGLALIAAAVILGWRQSIPWALAAAGILASTVALFISMGEDKAQARVDAKRAARKAYTDTH